MVLIRSVRPTVLTILGVIMYLRPGWVIGAPVVYLAMAVWLARVATPEELVTTDTIMIDRAAWGPAVLAGLLGSTCSAGQCRASIGAGRGAGADFCVPDQRVCRATHPDRQRVHPDRPP
jgi:hypothetical protein